MIVDNFEQIKGLINTTDNNEFYMVQILYRGKDGASKFFNLESKRNKSRVIKTYFVSSADYLEKKKEEIIALCDIFNARAYFNLNKKSWKQIGCKSISLLGQYGMKDEWSKIKSVIESACGETGACDNNKTWLVDVDTKNEQELQIIKDIINYYCEPNGDKILACIPTVHGFHLITKPFRVDVFKAKYKKQLDIHENNPTLLYYNAVNYKEDEMDKLVDEMKTKLKNANGINTEFVDLALPSGNLWAKCNILGTKETDYGTAYMWGQTNQYIEPSGDFYKVMMNMNIPNLLPEDDIAYTLMGEGWYVPSFDDFKEMLYYTDHEFVNNYNGSGVNGLVCKNRLDSSKSIFLPAAGIYEDMYFGSNTLGAYMVSNNYPDVWYVSFDNIQDYRENRGGCKWKMSVRPVKKVKKNP